MTRDKPRSAPARACPPRLEPSHCTLQRPGFVVAAFPCATELFLQRELMEFRRAGHSFDLFTLSAVRQATQEGLSATPLAYSGIASVGALRHLLGFRYSSGLRRMWYLMPRGPKDVVSVLARALVLAVHARARGLDHLHGCFATWPAEVCYLAAGLTNLEYSISAHAHDVWARPPLAAIVKRARAVIVCSRSAGRYLRARFPEARIVHVPHGIPSGEVTGDCQHERDDDTVLFAGRLVPKKNVGALIDALAILAHRGRPFRLTIVGDGPERRRLQKRAAARRIEGLVTFTGTLPHSELRQLMRRTRFFVFPGRRDSGTGDRDGIPNVILEAMTEKCIVIATPLDSVAEVVHHRETGYLCRAFTSDSIADMIDSASKDKDHWPAVAAKASPLIARKFDARRNAHKLWLVITTPKKLSENVMR